jgi:hypothetical protein
MTPAPADVPAVAALDPEEELPRLLADLRTRVVSSGDRR